MQKNILVLGGAGLVGSNLCCLLVEKGYDITAIDKNKHNLNILSQACKDVKTLNFDITNKKELEPYIKKADVVIQLQAQIMALSKEKFIKNNIDSVKTVASLCQKAKTKHLIHLSSSVVISVAKDNYTQTKRKGEEIVAKSKVPYTILRPPLLYGCFDAKHLGYITRIIERSLVVPIPGKGNYLRQPLYVIDLCKVIINLIEKKPQNKTYNIIGKEEIYFIDLLKTIVKTKNLKRMYLKIPIPVFVYLLRLYAFLTGKPPFIKDQLTALTAGDQFPVTDWNKEFSVPYTPFKEALEEMQKSKYYQYSKKMISPH